MEFLSKTNIDEIKNIISPFLSDYRYFQYVNYPAKNENGWQKFLFYQMEVIVQNDESYCFIGYSNNQIYLIQANVRNWDRELFGFYIASMNILFVPLDFDEKFFKDFLNKCLQFLVLKKKVKFTSFRINGDHIEVIHVLEDNGFRYFEDVIWPVLKVNESMRYESPDIMLVQEKDLDEVQYIARNFQYQRGHYHCDKNFDRKIVNELYAKWTKSYFLSGNPVVIIKHDDKVAGYFVLMNDKKLSDCLGYTYFRMRSLALNSDIRGKGLGISIFKGSISIMRDMGAEYIDSGYSTKNHISSKLHVRTNFNTVYEEITLHKWF
jgi:L-amino acid N-acyltransferase YncA